MLVSLILEHICSPVLDSGDGPMRYLDLYCAHAHALAIQLGPAGTVSRVCLTMDDGNDFLPPRDNPPSTQMTPTPIGLDSMLTRLDRLYESLHDTLLEAVVAILRPRWYNAETHVHLVEIMRRLREQMPNMAGRSLVFRLSQPIWEDLTREELFDTAPRYLFKRGGKYWKDIAVDDSMDSPSHHTTLPS